MSITLSGLRFAAGTIGSRVFGLARESIVAGVFGASGILDAFIIANRIPNILRELLAEGALGSSFTKVFTTSYENDPNKAKQLFIDCILFFTILMTIICLLGIIFPKTSSN